MNSLMTFTYFMGIVPLFLYAALHTLMLTSSISDHAERTKLTIRIGMIILFMLVVQYCQVLSEINLMILFTLVISVFVLSANKLYTEKNKDV